VPVVQDQRVLPLHEARRLQLWHPVETLLVNADAEASRKQRRGVFQHCRVGSIEMANGGEISLQSRTIECCLIQLLRRANECAGATSNGIDQRLEVAAVFGRQEDQGLLRALRNSDSQSFVGAGALPRLAPEKPVLRRWIGGTAQEADDQQVVLGLGRREIGLDRQFVARGQVWGLGDRQRRVTSRNGDLERGAGQIERRWTRGVCTGDRENREGR
jgi:hypothetical protein